MATRNEIKQAYLVHVGYVLQEDESYSNAFDRLLNQSPNLFPVPREGESLLDTIVAIVKK